MATANEDYRDAALRHQITVRRYNSGLVKRVLLLLERADRDLVEKLRARLPRFEGKPLDYTGQRWQALLKDIRTAREIAWKQYRELVRGELAALGPLEAEAETNILTMALPIEYGVATVALDQLRAIATSRPFQGRLLRDWFQTVAESDRRRLTQALQLGMTNGETTDEIVRTVVGTRKNGYTDGILSASRRDAAAVVRTAVNHVSNSARGYVWDANADIITARIWTATLDGRTSAVCRARDGKGAPVGDNPLPKGVLPLKPSGVRPPAHINCRSTMVAYIDGVGLLGRRPTVTDTRTRRKREIDFRRMAREQKRSIQDIRREWAEQNIGGVPATVGYEEWLRRQPASFQDEVLGVRKGRLFRQGGLRLDQFVDRAGQELTLDELAQRVPKAFERAGLAA